MKKIVKTFNCFPGPLETEPHETTKSNGLCSATEPQNYPAECQKIPPSSDIRQGNKMSKEKSSKSQKQTKT